MFDPTIYENLKIVIEGAIYDQDLNGFILVTAREDLIDLASLSRRFNISFQQRESSGSSYATGTISLKAHVHDLASEILGTANPDTELGCKLIISFDTRIKNIEETFDISQLLYDIWDFPPKLTQTVSYDVAEGLPSESVSKAPTDGFNVHVQLDFLRKINEQQIVDIGDIISLSVRSIQKLNERVIKDS